MRLFPESTFSFTTIDNCGEVVTGSTPSKDNSAYWGGQVPFVTPAQLGSQLPIMSADEYVTNDGAKRGRLLPEGSVLVCCIGSLGKTGVAGTPLISNQQINSIIFDPSKVDERYGYYTARCLTPLLEHFAPSTTIKIVKKSTFAQIEIPLPPLAEQKRIAAILDAADALRAKRRKTLAQLDTLLQATFLDMFGDPVTNPKGWEAVSLRSIADLENGDRSSNYPSGPDILEAGVLFLSTKNIVEDQLVFKSTQFISEEKFRSLSRGKLRRDDLVITLRGTLGSCAVFDCEFDTGFINAQLLILHPKQVVNSRFLHAFLTTDRMKDHFGELSTGAAVKQLTAKQIGSLTVPYPPVDLQHRFATIVESVEQQKSRQRAHLAELDTLFASLQSRAFNGEL